MRQPEVPDRAEDSLRRRFERLWYGRSPLAALLAPLSWLYGAVVAIRRGAYHAGWLRCTRLQVPVIVVGNIAAGGTGKTPVVAWIARFLHEQGWRPAIVSRGYGGRVGRGPRAVTADDVAAEVGDEPLLLYRETGVPVCVGADRARAAAQLVTRGADVIISDDGLQHYALCRDLEIAVVDGERRHGNGRLLPAGPLREPLSRLGEVECVLVNGGETGEEGAIGFTVVAEETTLPDGTDPQPLTALRGSSVRMLAGIGNPERFARLLASHGIRIAARLPVDDHGHVPPALLAAPGPLILMTTKDAVKYRLPADGSCRVVRVRAELPPRFGAWLLGRLANLRSAARVPAEGQAG